LGPSFAAAVAPLHAEANGDFELVLRVLTARHGYRQKARLGAELFEDRSHQARPHPLTPGLEPGVAIVVSFVVRVEIGRQLDPDDEPPLLAVDGHGPPSYSPTMGARLGVVCAEARTARAIAAHSRAAIDRPLRSPAELWVAVARDEAALLGAFQRGAGTPASWALARRGSGGPLVLVGEGTVHVALALAHPGALVAADEKRIVNRAVRPLLRALNRTAGARCPAHFFGRDWVSVAHRPAAWVGFAHDSTTRRTLFEAFVAVRTPFAPAERPSFRGRLQGTLESIAGYAVDSARLAEAVIEAYASDAEEVVFDGADAPDDTETTSAMAGDPRADPPWAATCEEAIGPLGAGADAHGAFRVGGDLLVSRDALARLELGAASAREGDLGALVDETLGGPGVALDGIKSLASVRDVIHRARFG
jgi:hypothetical protein